MPFSYIMLCFIKKASCTLQVLRPQIKKMKRVFLSTSQKAGITLEASIVTTALLLSTLSLLGLMMTFHTIQSMHMALENTARKTARNIFYIEQIGEIADRIGIDSQNQLLEKVKLVLSNNGITLSEEDEDVLKEKADTAVFNTYVYTSFISELSIDKINKSMIRGGIIGLDFTKSSYSRETGKINLVLNYRLSIPYVMNGFFGELKSEAIYTQAWTGRDIAAEENLVYITKSGTVYHTSRSCSHLNINIEEIDFKELENARNNSGGKYKKCNRCVGESKKTGSVYITKYGGDYHVSLSCGGLSRSVMVIDISQVGDKNKCKDCPE